MLIPLHRFVEFWKYVGMLAEIFEHFETELRKPSTLVFEICRKSWNRDTFTIVWCDHVGGWYWSELCNRVFWDRWEEILIKNISFSKHQILTFQRKVDENLSSLNCVDNYFPYPYFYNHTHIYFMVFIVLDLGIRRFSFLHLY